MKKVILKLSGSSHNVSEYLMGHNLEMYTGGTAGMLKERIENPKFLGPGNLISGCPKSWEGTPLGCRIVSGMSLGVGEAVMITGVNNVLWQSNRRIYKGEILEVELWSKVCHYPVELKISLRSKKQRQPNYASETISINSSYWKKYILTLKIPTDDENAVFHIQNLSEGTVYLDQVHLRPVGEPHVDNKIKEAFNSIGITALRFPGGCISTVYHWKNGTGPIHLRPVHHDPQFNGMVSYDFGIAEYLEMCLEQGITPQITVNIGSGTPDEAAECAAYCRDFYEKRNQKAPDAFFQMGNEQYAAHSSAHMTGEMYVAALKEFIPAVKKEYPNSRIIAVGYPYSGEFGTQKRTDWRGRVLDEIPGMVDFISNHYYKGQWQDTFKEQSKNAVDSIGKIRDDLLKMIDDIKERGLNTKIAVTEWNYWLYASNVSKISPDQNYYEPMDPVHCLFVAGMLQMMAGLGEYVGISNYYHLLNGLSIFTNFADRFHESPMAEIFRFFRPAFPGRFIEIKNNSPEYVNDIKVIETMCIKTKKEHFLFVINFSVDESFDLELPAKFASFAGEMMTFQKPEKGKEIFPLKRKITTSERILPPYSIVKFHKCN